jgi:hypothetical protein
MSSFFFLYGKNFGLPKSGSGYTVPAVSGSGYETLVLRSDPQSFVLRIRIGSRMCGKVGTRNSG